MSRLPPVIEQIIDGKKVEGWNIRPIFDEKWNRYELSSNHKLDKEGTPIGLELFVASFSKDGKMKWKTLYYSKKYIPFLETDVQDVFPVDFSLNDNTFVIKLEHYSENDRIFYIMKEDGDVKLKSPY